MRKFLQAVISGLCVLAMSIAPSLTHAAASSAYAAVQVTTPGSITMTPGEVKSVTATFQNSGTSTWKNDGTGYISLYTHGPKYRKSAFDPGTWLSPTQVKRIKEVAVAAGKTATVTFDLHAPQAEGSYTETFALAAEELAWVSGGQFSINITVKKTAASVAKSAPTTVVTSGTTSAQLVAQTATELSLKAGKMMPFSAAFKNTGSTSWTSLSLKDAATGAVAASLTNQKIAPGQTIEMQFVLTAPNTNGTHKTKLQFVANDNASTTYLEVPITVTEGSDTAPSKTPDAIVVDTKTYIEEPIMRVGVLIVDEETNNEVKIGSDESDIEVRDTNGAVLTTIAKGASLRAAYANGVYTFGSGETSLLPLRFVPTTANAVLEITNFDRRVTRGTSFANNTFRNVLELRYNTKKARTWIINELPMEHYLRGLAETSNSSPMEYQKAILTAARTYAYYHYQNPSKHAAEGYHVDAYKDQVYWGYDQESRNPKITEAVEATRGQIVTYNGATAITPYFSRSNGKTRNWNDVWGGNVPYAVSVIVPCDAGKTEWGHGVGISASGAICMANEGKAWNEILTYFYTGIAIDQKWK